MSRKKWDGEGNNSLSKIQDCSPSMPRIPTSTVIKAYRQNPLLPILLQECRSVSSAQNELRWLRERAIHAWKQWPWKYSASGWKTLLRTMCKVRSKGMPLQYILGDQPFGNLEILCEKGVLIPRFVAFFPTRQETSLSL